MTELSQIKGIKPRQIKLLEENGISSAEALAMTAVNLVEDIQGIGDKTAKKLIWNAREALEMSEFTCASEIDEHVETITTGSAELNRILGGGMQTGKLTEVYGPFKSGKTNLAHTVAVCVQMPEDRGGINGAVAYIDTENTFSRDKIRRIALRFGLNPDDILSKIYQARIYSTDHQVQMIQKAENLCKTRNVRLIIVDSLMALMRAEYVGIGMLARRQAMLNSIIHALSRIAEVYNVAVLLTNQVATQMKGMFSADDAIGGNIVAHGCHFRVMFKTKGFSSNNSLKRRAVIVDAPDLPPEECEFFITPAGLADTEEVDIPKEIPKATAEKITLDEVFEEEGEEDGDEDEGQVSTPITTVEGIGSGTAKKLQKYGIKSVLDLVNADSKALASSISGISDSMIDKWKESAQSILT